jgi:hypothetical protein
VLLSDEFLYEQENDVKNVYQSSLPLRASINKSMVAESDEHPLKRARSDPLPLPYSLLMTESPGIPRPSTSLAVDHLTDMMGRDPLQSVQETAIRLRQQQSQSQKMMTTCGNKSLLYNDWFKETETLKNGSSLIESNTNKEEKTMTLNELLLKTLPPHLPPLNRHLVIKKPNEKSEKLKKFLYQIPNIRFLPKKATIRPITNLRSKSLPVYKSSSSSSSSYGVLSNRMLYNCYHVLKAIYDKNYENMKGFSVFGLDEIYQKLASYKHEVFQQHSQQQQQRKAVDGVSKEEKRLSFYVMTLDLQKCYDHINPSLLYDILVHVITGNDFPYKSYFPSYPVRSLRSNDKKEPLGEEGSILKNSQLSQQSKRNEAIFPQEDALTYRYTIIHTINSMKRIIIKPLKIVTFDNELLSFSKIGKEIAANYPNSLIYDNVVASKLNYKELLRLIKQHLFYHIIKMPMNHCFPLSALSPALSSIPSMLNGKQKLRRKRKRKGLDAATNHRNRGTNSVLGGTNQSNQTYNIHTHYFTQIKGIPQGSVLSPLLCNIYYGFLEKIFFKLLLSSSLEHNCNKSETEDTFGLQSNQTCVTRLMDDYLIISTNLRFVSAIYNVIEEIFPVFGGMINKTKIQTNFPLSVLSNGNLDSQLLDTSSPSSSSSLLEEKMISYCGLRIDSKSLFIEPHLEKLFPSSLSSTHNEKLQSLYHSVNINHYHITFGLQKSMKQFFRIKCHAIFLDNQMNYFPNSCLLISKDSKQWIVKNLYLLFLLTAIRSFLYFSKIQKYYFSKLINEFYFYHSGIKELMNFAYSLIQIRTNHKICRKLSFHNGHLISSSLLDQQKNDHDDESDDDDDDDEEEEEGNVYDVQESEEEIEEKDKMKGGRKTGRRNVIDSFGNCPLTSIEVSNILLFCGLFFSLSLSPSFQVKVLGWKAFNEVSKYYPEKFKLHRRKNETKAATNLQKSEQQKKTKSSKLQQMIEKELVNHLTLLKKQSFGNWNPQGTDSSVISSSSLSIDGSQALALEQLLPHSLAIQCEQNILQYLL